MRFPPIVGIPIGSQLPVPLIQRFFNRVQILLTNDDGIFAPGLSALKQALASLGDVCVVAPATEQSGVGHSITYLSPLTAKEIFDGTERRGWAVEGSPADCVKLALGEFCPQTPDLVVSGINGGLNLGINVLYSGTIAAATEGALNHITSVAVSLEYDDHPNFQRAAEIAVSLIGQILAQPDANKHQLYSINIPISATREPAEVRVVPLAVQGWTAEFDKRSDPKGRQYFWASGTPPRGTEITDVQQLAKGHITLTPLMVARTNHTMLDAMHHWKLLP